MALDFDDWSAANWDRNFALHTSQVETVKLLVTFSLGIAATLVASALQVQAMNNLDKWAVIFLTLAFLLTVAAVLLDQLDCPDRTKALEKKSDNGWSTEQLLAYVESLERDLERANDAVVARVRHAAEFQVLAAVAAGGCAAVSLLVGQA